MVVETLHEGSVTGPASVGINAGDQGAECGELPASRVFFKKDRHIEGMRSQFPEQCEDRKNVPGQKVGIIFQLSDAAHREDPPDFPLSHRYGMGMPEYLFTKQEPV